MSSRLLGWLGAVDGGWKNESQISADPTAWTGGGWTVPTAAGQRVGPDRAMGFGPYFACNRNISEDVGKLPLLTYERLEPRGKRRAPEHPCSRLLKTRWNPYMSSMAGREALISWAMGWGRGIAEIVRDGRMIPRELWPIHSSRVVPKWEDGRLVYDISTDDLTALNRQGRERPLRLLPENVLHIHGLGDGFDGFSIAQLAAQTIGAGIAGELQAASYFGNGVRLSGVLEHPGKLGDKAQKNIRESMIQPHQGAQNAWDVLIAEEGMKFKDAPRISPADAQFIESRQFQVEEVARWHRMPPHKIGHLERSTNNNIEHQGIEYVVDTLQPWLVRAEQEYAAKLFDADERYFAEHVVNGLMRGDSAARSAFYREMIYAGVYSQDDVRELENENPIPNGAGAHYWMQVNMAPLEALAAPARRVSANPNDRADIEPASVLSAAMLAALAPKNGAHAEDSRRLVVELSRDVQAVLRPHAKTVETEITEWNAQGRPVKSVQREVDRG